LSIEGEFYETRRSERRPVLCWHKWNFFLFLFFYLDEIHFADVSRNLLSSYLRLSGRSAKWKR